MYEGELYPGKALVWCVDQAAARTDLVVTKVENGKVWSRRFGKSVEEHVTEEEFREKTSEAGYRDQPVRRRT